MKANLESRNDLNILISDETGQLRTAAAAAKGLKQLPPGPVLVMNAELFWEGEPAGEASNLRKLQNFSIRLPCYGDALRSAERSIGHDGKKDFSLGTDHRLSRYREGDPNPVVLCGRVCHAFGFLADAPKTRST